LNVATVETESAPSQKLPYGTPGKSIQEFIRDSHFIRVLIGGRGAGKTVGLAEDITAHCFQNAGAKAIVARETEVSQSDSSIESFWRYFESLGPLYSPGGPGLFRSWNNGRTFRIPSRLAIEAMQRECAHMTTRAEIAHWIQTRGDKLCGYIEFRGLPNADKGKFRGMECSYFAIVEADQVAEKQFQLALACLRWKGTDPETCDEKGFIRDKCVVLDTNPPSEQHWIAEFEKRQGELPEHDRVARFWHIPTFENEHNLPENYIRDQILLPYANNPALIERMLWGRYADAFEGKPVIYAFQRGFHEWTPSRPGERMPWINGAKMIASMDVGTNNFSVISAVKEHRGHTYWRALKEIYLTDSDTDRQCLELLRVLAEQFPFWNSNPQVCPEVRFVCDPAARNKSFTKRGSTESALAVMHSHGIFPAYRIGAGLNPSLAIVNRLMQQNHVEKLADGSLRTVWHFQISATGCPLLCRALRGEYRYPLLGEPGFGQGEPLKGELCNGADHKADGLRYGVIHVFGLGQETHSLEMTPKLPPTVNSEPARRI
jgi:hypothetical protein